MEFDSECFPHKSAAWCNLWAKSGAFASNSAWRKVSLAWVDYGSLFSLDNLPSRVSVGEENGDELQVETAIFKE